jgi:hypothetical protein
MASATRLNGPTTEKKMERRKRRIDAKRDE